MGKLASHRGSWHYPGPSSPPWLWLLLLLLSQPPVWAEIPGLLPWASSCPGLPRRVGVCLTAWLLAQCLGRMPLNLSPLCSLQPGVFTAHSHASLSHQTLPTEHTLKEKIPKNSRWQPQNIKSKPGPHLGTGLLCEWGLMPVKLVPRERKCG